MNPTYLEYLRVNDTYSSAKSRLKCDELFRTGTNRQESAHDRMIVRELGPLNHKLELRIQNIDRKEKWITRNYKEGFEENKILWYINKCIRVFKQRDIPESWALNIVKGVQDALNQVGLDFVIKYHGTHDSAEELIAQAAGPDGTNAYDLGNLAFQESWRDETISGIQHADVFVISSHNSREVGIIPGSFGIGSHSQGYVIMWQNSRSVTTHEVGHLLGVPQNHGEPLMEACSKFYDNKKCVMHWHVPSNKFCDHCLDRLRGHWKGLEDAKNKKYFKQKTK